MTRALRLAFGCAVALLGGMLLPRPVQAQHTVAAGDLVRVTSDRQVAHLPGRSRHTGRLLAYDADSLRLETGGRSLTFPRHAVQRLEVRRGQKTGTGRGALIGAAAGGLVLGIAAAADASGCTSWCFVSPGGAFAAGFLVGALPGATIGALVGSQHRTPRWVEVPVGGGLSVTPTVGRHGGGLTLRLATPGR